MIVEVTYEGKHTRLHSFTTDKVSALNSVAYYLNMPKVPVDEGRYTKADLDTNRMMPYSYTRDNTPYKEIISNGIKVIDGESYMILPDDGGFIGLEKEEVDRIHEYIVESYNDTYPAPGQDASFHEAVDEILTVTNDSDDSIIDIVSVDVTDTAEVELATVEPVAEATPAPAPTAPKQRKDRRATVQHSIPRVNRTTPDSMFMTEARPTGVLTQEPILENPLVNIVIPTIANPAPEPSGVAAVAPSVNREQKPQRPKPPTVTKPESRTKPVAPEVSVTDGDYPALHGLTDHIYNTYGYDSIVEYDNGYVIVRPFIVDENSVKLFAKDKVFVVDVNGYVISPTVKWWPGDDITLQKACDGYNYSFKTIDLFFTGKPIPKDLNAFNKATCELNKIVDLRQIFNTTGISNTQALSAMKLIKDKLSKELVAAARKVGVGSNGVRFDVSVVALDGSCNLLTSGLNQQFKGNPYIIAINNNSKAVLETLTK